MNRPTAGLHIFLTNKKVWLVSAKLDCKNIFADLSSYIWRLLTKYNRVSCIKKSLHDIKKKYTNNLKKTLSFSGWRIAEGVTVGRVRDRKNYISAGVYFLHRCSKERFYKNSLLLLERFYVKALFWQ